VTGPGRENKNKTHVCFVLGRSLSARSRGVGQRQGAQAGGPSHTRPVRAAGRVGQPGRHGGRRDIARTPDGRGTGREAQQPGGPHGPDDDRGGTVLQQRQGAADEEQGQTVVSAVPRARRSFPSLSLSLSLRSTTGVRCT